ncbi:MAG: MgtC/SapB family protein [Acidobacteria bacterium]|nr:MgtC/SapB family protein [Acidobacteriota bacterium]
MELSALFQQLFIALGLGLLVGLQRESAASPLAGVRTFPLVTILGAVSALLAQAFGGWLLAAAFLALAALIFSAKLAEQKRKHPDLGITTEAALLLMFAVGAYLIVGQRPIAIAIGGGTAVLLHFKGELHGLVGRLGATDLKAIMQFALISLVILPVLPNRTYGPYAVINPRHVWYMVVLIVGISLGGYIVYKFFGQRAGLVLGGLLGGLISSTATTVSYARRTKETPASVHHAAIVILIASTIVFARLLLEMFAVAPAFFVTALRPFAVVLFVFLLLSAWLYFRHRQEAIAMPEQENPSELKSALFFGVLYAAVLFAAAAVKERFGSSGLYVVAAISGLTDVDAITLSTAQLVRNERLDAAHGWRVVMVAALSNLLFKAAAIAALGHRRLLMHVATAYGIALLIGLGLLFYWP